MTTETSKEHEAPESNTSVWSLALIARNEEATIGQVLDDASAFCDELVVVDTGSTDDTVDIAKARGATVHHFEWIDDFSAARNFSFDQCHGDWVVWLDADDRVPPVAQEGFRALRQQLAGRDDFDGVMVTYRIQFSEQNRDVCAYSFDRERVHRRRAGLRWVGPVHEVIALPADRWMRWPEAWVEHRPLPDRPDKKRDRNLGILERARAAGDHSPRTLFYYANELRDHRRFEEALTTYREYLTVSDLEWEKYSALLHMADCAQAIGQPEERLRLLFDAVALDSRRAEAFNRLGAFFYDRRDWQRAIPFFVAATSLERPRDGFISDADYAWLPWDYLAICLNECGRAREALEHTLRALLTTPDRKRLLENIPFYLDRLNEHERGH
jgi:glycosyltransferase involved in cell wall biosynthesis